MPWSFSTRRSTVGYLDAGVPPERGEKLASNGAQSMNCTLRPNLNFRLCLSFITVTSSAFVSTTGTSIDR